MGAALVPIMTDATRRLFGSRPARYVPAIVVFMPGLLWFASVPVREAGVFFLMSVALNCGVRLAERVTLWTVATLSLTLAALVTFRFQVALLLCVGLLFAIVVAGRQRVRTMVAVAVPVGVLAVGLSLGVGRAALESYTATDPLETAAFYRSSPSELYPLPAGERSTFEADADVETLSGALSYLPVGYVYAFFSPFPWMVRSTAQAVGVIDGGLWILFLPSLLRGARRGVRLSGKKILILVIPAILIATVVALAINNVATVIRGRTHVGLLLAPIVAVGIWQRRAEEELPR
jgi:4-amino-4-deoxy-L-arabinose transferase-like glycosyltransferase